MLTLRPASLLLLSLVACDPKIGNLTNFGDTDESGDESASETTNSATSGGPACGDGVLQLGEACDDGNSVDGDGCTANCTLEAPGPGTTTTGTTTTGADPGD